MAAATPMPIASRKRSATCSWTSPARIAAPIKSCAPARVAFAPSAARARVVVKVGRADSRPLMQLEVFRRGDAATEHAGKLNIIGTFDSLRAFEAPISHPQCAIAGRLRFEEIEEGEHRVVLTFADEDGNIVMPKFDSKMAVKFLPGQRTVTSHFVILIQQVRLPKFGEYTIDLAIDGRQLGSLPLYVTQIERPN